MPPTRERGGTFLVLLQSKLANEVCCDSSTSSTCELVKFLIARSKTDREDRVRSSRKQAARKLYRPTLQQKFYGHHETITVVNIVGGGSRRAKIKFRARFQGSDLRQLPPLRSPLSEEMRAG